MVLKACVRYIIAGAFVLSSLAAWGQQNLQTMPFGTPIGNDTAKKMAAAAVAEAKKNSWPVCVAIVDYHGELVYFERLDNT